MTSAMHEAPQQERDLTTAILVELRRERGRLDLAYAELSRRTGVPANTIRKHLKRQGDITLEEVVRTAEALGVRLSEVVQAAERITLSTNYHLSPVDAWSGQLSFDDVEVAAPHHQGPRDLALV